jgi:hypothetical protein
VILIGAGVKEKMPGPTGRLKPPNWFYAIFESPFVVWLEPEGKWLEILQGLSALDRRNPKYRRGGGTVWKHGQQKEQPPD